MKTITRSNICLSMRAMILMAALAVPVAAQQRVPFNGSFHGKDEDKPSPIPNTIVVKTIGSGIGTHLGQFSVEQEVTVNALNGTDTGSAHLVAANGDRIDVVIAGSGQPTSPPGVFSVTEVWTVTGGTGRFAGAQGSAVVQRLADANMSSTSGSFYALRLVQATEDKKQ
jgi:hypothetical protein